MKPQLKAKVLVPVFESTFVVGEVYKVMSIENEMVHLLDPLYEGTDEDNAAWWPFMEDEVEIIK